MAHFARIDSNNIVTQVIVAEQDFIDTLPDKTSWIQTSYNTYGGKHYDPNTGLEDDKPPLRKNYAGIGFTYDADLDAFIPEQPFNSWILNTGTCMWEAPVAMPEDAGTGEPPKSYSWDEATTSWKET